MRLRSLLASAIAALLVPAAASAAPGRGPASDQITFGGFVGYEAGDFDGFGARLDGEVPIAQLAPQWRLSGVGSFGVTRIGKDLGSMNGYDLGSYTDTILKLVPAARLTLQVNPQFSFYGDAGLGLYHASFSYYYTQYVGYPYYGYYKYKFSDSTNGVMMRLAAGGFFQVGRQVKLGAELALNPYFGDVDTHTWSVMLGAMFALR